MPGITIDFSLRPEIKDTGFLCVAEITGDENIIIDYLRALVKLEKNNLRAQGKLPDYCDNCHIVFGVEVCREGKFLFFKHCCGIKGIITLEKIKHLLSEEFDVIE